VQCESRRKLKAKTAQSKNSSKQKKLKAKKSSKQKKLKAKKAQSKKKLKAKKSSKQKKLKAQSSKLKAKKSSKLKAESSKFVDWVDIIGGGCGLRVASYGLRGVQLRIADHYPSVFCRLASGLCHLFSGLRIAGLSIADFGLKKIEI